MIEIITKCENPTCRIHTQIEHGPNCVKSGRSKCQDYIHNKTCWTTSDLEMASNMMDKVIIVDA